MHVGQQDAAAGAHCTRQLRDGRTEILEVTECQRAHGEVELTVVDGQRMEITLEQASIGEARKRARASRAIRRRP
jgi:hypothetical protein